MDEEITLNKLLRKQVGRRREYRKEREREGEGEPFQAEFRIRVKTKTTLVRFGLEWNEVEHPSFSILTRVVVVLTSSTGF